MRLRNPSTNMQSIADASAENGIFDTGIFDTGIFDTPCIVIRDGQKTVVFETAADEVKKMWDRLFVKHGWQ